jgi:hypothetical protein
MYGFAHNLTFSEFLNPEDSKASTNTAKFGDLASYLTVAPGLAFADGSWAVTAE